MSADQTPKKSGRKPRFFRPGDASLPAQDAREDVDRMSDEQAATNKLHNDPASPPRQKDASAGYHQPKDKRPSNNSNETGFDAEETPDDFEGAEGQTLPTLNDLKQGFRWTAILMGAVGALAAMAFTAWLHSHVEGLMARQDWIGWLALGLVAIVCFTLLIIAIKEVFALRRLKKLGNLRDRAERALKHDERKPAQKIQSQIANLFHGRHSLSWGMAALKEHKDEVMSARDRLILVERNLIAPLDADARKIVADHAKKVSVMTAISPFVFLDMLMVGVQNFKMLRRLMTLYGGRPGLFSQFKMIRMMIANLALSGGIAVGTDLVGHIVGGQVATKLAGRIGEGMINGSLTARLGITATKLIRPLPYIEAKPTSIKAFVKELTRGSKEKR